MHKLTRDRIELVRAIQKVVDRTGQGLLLEMLLRCDILGHYVSFSQDNPKYISYASKPADKFDSKKRIKLAFSRYIRRRLKIGADRIPDKILADIASKIFGILSGDEYIKIVEGSAIVDAYRDHFGGSSCMTGANADDFLEIYRDNPDKIKLVKYTNPDTAHARALLWHTDAGNTVLDRIYPVDDGPHVNALLEWAKKKGYAYRNGQSAGIADTPLSRTGAEQVTLAWPESFPYMDTFVYGSEVDGDLVLCTASKDYQFYVTETNGTNSRGDGETGGYYCCQCEERVSEENTHNSESGETYCYNCYCETYSACDRCGNEVVREDCYCVCDDILCQSCYENNAATCRDCEESNYLDNLTGTIGGEYVCESCRDDNGWASCDSCGELTQDISETEDGDLCENCQ